MNNIMNNKFCSGCTACKQKCPVGAISIVSDSEGFLSARVNDEKCVNCGACLSVCPILNADKVKHSIVKPYVAINCDENVLKRSSSGGAFSVFAEYVLNNGGVVYGCAMQNNIAVHTRIDNIENLDRLRRSKYVQSELGDTYKHVGKDLKSGFLVLFSGTPCQVAGLRLFLGKEYPNLYCIDLICHGVSSPEMFKMNIQWWEKRLNSKVEKYEFRLKSGFPVYSFFFHSSSKSGGGVVTKLSLSLIGKIHIMRHFTIASHIMRHAINVVLRARIEQVILRLAIIFGQLISILISTEQMVTEIILYLV